jgi:hypothetical protein
VFIHRSLKRDTTFVFYDTKYPFGQYSHRLPSQPDTAARALVVKVNDENTDQMDIWCRKTQMSYLFLNFYE